MSLNLVVYRRNSLLAQPRIRRHPIVSKNALKFPFGESAMCPTTWSQQLLPWIILVFCLIEYSLNETASPRNHAAENGAQVQLNCSWPKKDEVLWLLNSSLIDGKTTQIVIYSENHVDDSFKDRFKVDDSSEGNFNLLFNASKSTSGRFTCPAYGLAGDAGIKTAQVIALDPRPECSREYEPGGVKAKCSIGFSGFWSPKLEWLNASVTLEPNYINETTTPYIRVNSAATVPFNETDSRAPYSLTCTPKFSLENIPPDTTAKNIPEYPNSCTVTIDRRPPEPPTPTLKQPPKAPSKGTNDTKSDTGDSVSVHNWHSLYLCQCFAASVLIGMLHKWLGQ